MDALQLGADSLIAGLEATGLVGEAWTIPDNRDGRKPRFVYLACDVAVCFLMANDVGGTATSPSGLVPATITTTNSCLLRPNQPLVVNSAAFDRIITLSFAGAGSENLCITPLEN